VNVLVRVAGGLCLLVVAIGLVSLAGGSKKARLGDIQLGHDTGKVERLLSDPARRDAVRRAIGIDYPFLVAYWLAFTALGVVVVRRGDGWAAAGVAAIVAALATAALDVTENVRTIGVVDTVDSGRPLGQAQLDALRHASLLKWSASATTVLLLAALFAQRRWVAVIALALVALAAIGYAGLVRHGLLDKYIGVVGLLTVVVGGLCLASPQTVVRGF
jgi:hypothetical protein